MRKQQRNIQIMCDALAKLLFYLLSLLFFFYLVVAVPLLVLKVPIFVRIWLFVVFSQCFWLVTHQDLSLNHIPEKCLENMIPYWKRQYDRHPIPPRKLYAVISKKFKVSFQPFVIMTTHEQALLWFVQKTFLTLSTSFLHSFEQNFERTLNKDLKEDCF